MNTKIFHPFDKIEVKEMQRERIKEIKMWRIFHEVFVYILFFWILCVVCYANTNSQTFKFQRNMKDMFVSEYLKEDFSNVN
jgi:hypothetical protein